MTDQQFKRLFLKNLSNEKIEWYVYDIDHRTGNNALRVALRDSGEEYWSVTEHRGDYADETLAYLEKEELLEELDRRT